MYHVSYVSASKLTPLYFQRGYILRFLSTHPHMGPWTHFLSSSITSPTHSPESHFEEESLQQDSARNDCQFRHLRKMGPRQFSYADSAGEESGICPDLPHVCAYNEEDSVGITSYSILITEIHIPITHSTTPFLAPECPLTHTPQIEKCKNS